MVSPIILCNGLIRSGSTWSFNVCRMLGQLVASRKRQIFGSAYLDDKTLERFFQRDVNLREGPAVVKSHEIGLTALEWIRTGRAYAVCTLRDPRDCVASDIAFWGKGLDASVQRVVASLKRLPSYQDFGRTLFVRYEEMMSDRLWQITRIAAYLNIPVNESEVKSVDALTNIEYCRKISQGLRMRDEKDVDIVMDVHRRDPITLLHDNHFGSGEVGRWRHDLTAEQGARLTQFFRQSLQTLGCETSLQTDLSPHSAETTPSAAVSLPRA
jgi:hypothetical protein